jgi:hypothetical protein
LAMKLLEPLRFVTDNFSKDNDEEGPSKFDTLNGQGVTIETFFSSNDKVMETTFEHLGSSVHHPLAIQNAFSDLSSQNSNDVEVVFEKTF